MYLTKLINERRRPVEVREMDGTIVATLPPRGGRDEIATENANAVLAPYSEVRFVDKEPWAYLTPREGFIPPKRLRPCTFVLRGGKEAVEYAALKDRPLCLMRGVPVVVDLDLTDRYVLYNLVELGIPTLKRYASDRHDGLVAIAWEFEERCQNRPMDEIERIQQEIEALAPPQEVQSV